MHDPDTNPDIKEIEDLQRSSRRLGLACVFMFWIGPLMALALCMIVAACLSFVANLPDDWVYIAYPVMWSVALFVGVLAAIRQHRACWLRREKGLEKAVPNRLEGGILAYGLLGFVLLFLFVIEPWISNGKRRALEIHSYSNLKQIWITCNNYAEKNDGMLPLSLAQIEASRGPYGSLESPYPMPPDERESTPGYDYFPRGNRDDITNPETVILAKDSMPGPTGRTGVLYLDGRVEWVLPLCSGMPDRNADGTR